MVAPTTPAPTKFHAEPPITFTVSRYAVGSSRSPRWLFTLNSSGWLSVVPRKCVPGVVPALPRVRQKVGLKAVRFRSPGVIVPSVISADSMLAPSRLTLALNRASGTVPLVSWLALSAVRFAPLPAKLLAALLSVTGLEYVPLRLVPANAPFKLPAVIAYGVAVIGWRGMRLVNAPPPLVRTPISSQRPVPVKFAPKSSATVNKPLLTLTGALVSGDPTWLPTVSASKSAKRKW